MQIQTRELQPGDLTTLHDFTINTRNNLADADIFTYPTTRIRVAERAGRPLVYMPTQRVTMLESLAIAPDATPHETAFALATLVRDLKQSEPLSGIREMYFVCTDESTAKFAGKYFEELPYRTFRMKVGP